MPVLYFWKKFLVVSWQWSTDLSQHPKEALENTFDKAPSKRERD